MLRTTTLVTDLRTIPVEWIFEYYLGLSERLTGQRVKITSIWNTREKDPSMFIFLGKNGKYRYSDFSTGKGGDCIDLVVEMFNLTSRGEAAYKIIEDYNQFIITNDYDKLKIKPRSGYKVTDYEKRGWTKADANYWMKFNIGSKVLEYYNVAPLSWYRMERKQEDGVQEMSIEGRMIYGYFRKDGEIYKIYQPMVSKKKFIKVRNYIQGMEQIDMNRQYLVITSSLKDIMTMSGLAQGLNYIAPDTESVVMKPSVIEDMMRIHKGICTLFDNDPTGIKSAKRYMDEYGIPAATLTGLSKDPSDSVRDFGTDKTWKVIKPEIKKALKISRLHIVTA